MTANVPHTIRRLFWDMDSEQLNVRTHEKSIIERVLNDGTLDDWRWLIAAYGSQAIKNATHPSSRFPLRNGVREQSSRLASLIIK